jgi:uncharacterized surface protein with fasciclin (FAS1) repeats
MRTNNVFKIKALVSLVLFVIVLAGIGCKKASIIERTSEDVNITGYLDKNPEQFSEFRKIMELSETSGFLQAYGAYTIFLPTNDAVKAYLAEKGIASVDLLTKEAAKDIVTLHVVEDSIKTTDFSDGKLRNATMYGQYLVSGAVNVNGVSRIQIDNQASIITGNISVGNGIIHVIDKVLKPATMTIAQTLESNPEKYSIFTEALKLTGFYERLNFRPKENPTESEKYLTIFAETNDALREAGILDIGDLVDNFNSTDPTNPADSLNLYVAYHVVKGAYYFIDILNPVKLATLSPKSITTTTKSDTEVAINEVLINNIIEEGAPVLRTQSDLTASNGVVHAVHKHYFIVNRPATALYWDVADQPEFRKQSAWRSGSYTYDIAKMPPMANLKWDIKTMIYRGNFGRGYWNDVLQTPLVSPDAPGTNTLNRANYIEFHSPYLAPGKYKLWVCYPRAGRGGPMVFWFNGKKLNRTVDLFVGSGTGSMTDEQREQLGWKRYMGPSNINIDNAMGRLLGTVTVTEEGTQVIRMENSNGSYHNDYYIDMFHFIPEKDEQLWPRFWTTGRVQQKGEPD